MQRIDWIEDCKPLCYWFLPTLYRRNARRCRQGDWVEAPKAKFCSVQLTIPDPSAKPVTHSDRVSLFGQFEHIFKLHFLSSDRFCFVVCVSNMRLPVSSRYGLGGTEIKTPSTFGYESEPHCRYLRQGARDSRFFLKMHSLQVNFLGKA